MYRLRDELRPLARTTGQAGGRSVSRIGGCGAATFGEAGSVSIVVGEEGSAHWTGLVRCGSVWECPVCSLAIRAGRAEELRQVVDTHGGRRAVMLTLTLRHGAGDDLGRMAARLAEAYRGLTRGKPWKRFAARLGVVGSVRALEVTHGWRNGWHPHLHVVLLLDEPPAAAQMLDTDRGVEWTCAGRGWLIDRWRGMVARYVQPVAHCVCGQDATEAELRRRPVCSCGRAFVEDETLGNWLLPDDEHGVSLRPLSRADYLAKLGLEIESPAKRARAGHRTPWQIAYDWTQRHGRRDGELWRQYCAAMLGRRQLTWSAGLKLRFGVTERTDAELAAAEEDSASQTIVLTVPVASWAKLRRRPGATCYLLELAERGGSDLARRGLERLLGATAGG